MKFQQIKNQCMQGVDYSSVCMRAFVWDFEGPQRVSNAVPWRGFISKLVIKRGLELVASALGSTFGKEEVGFRFLMLASSLLQVLLMKD
jgi:hypothetical protein